MRIDAATAPRPRPDVAQARLGAGLVLYETGERRLHTLNTSAGLVWRRMDGLTTMWDIAGSLADVFAADRALIEGDVGAVVSRFGELGLLSEGVDDGSGLPDLAGDPQEAALRARLDERAWPVVSAVHQAVGLAFRVRSEDAEVAESVLRVLHPLATDEEHAPHAYSVRVREHDGAPQWRVYFDGTPLGTVTSADAATALVLWHLNRAVLDHTAGVLFFQASSVQVGDRALLFTGAPGAGTSTLTTALVRRGYSYVADELSGLDVAVGRMLPYPRSIALSAASQALFPDIFPPATVPRDPEARGRWYLDPARIPGATIGTGGRPALVIAPHFVAGSPTHLSRVTDVDALRLLLDHTFPFDGLGARGFHALVAVVQQAPVYRLDYGDFDAACEVVLQLVREF